MYAYFVLFGFKKAGVVHTDLRPDNIIYQWADNKGNLYVLEPITRGGKFYTSCIWQRLLFSSHILSSSRFLSREVVSHSYSHTVFIINSCRCGIVQVRLIDFDDALIEGELYPEDVASCNMMDTRYPIHYVNDTSVKTVGRLWQNVWFYKYVCFFPLTRVLLSEPLSFPLRILFNTDVQVFVCKTRGKGDYRQNVQTDY